MPYQTIIIALCAALLSSCATFVEQECRTADWYEVGKFDASVGRGSDVMAEHAQRCAGYSVIPDTEAYERGYSAGLKTYCTDQVARSHGAAGTEYHSTLCGETKAAELDNTYYGALRQYVSGRVEGADSKKRHAKQSLDALESEIKRLRLDSLTQTRIMSHINELRRALNAEDRSLFY